MTSDAKAEAARDLLRIPLGTEIQLGPYRFRRSMGPVGSDRPVWIDDDGIVVPSAEPLAFALTTLARRSRDAERYRDMATQFAVQTMPDERDGSLRAQLVIVARITKQDLETLPAGVTAADVLEVRFTDGVDAMIARAKENAL